MFHLVNHFLSPVALNYQTADKQNTLNRALFADNGGCGYILKPDFLLDPESPYSVTSPANLDREKNPRWTINLQVRNEKEKKMFSDRCSMR